MLLNVFDAIEAYDLDVNTTPSAHGEAIIVQCFVSVEVLGKFVVLAERGDVGPCGVYLDTSSGGASDILPLDEPGNALTFFERSDQWQRHQF